LVLIAPIADCRLVPIDECELEGAAFNVGFAASILLMWSTAVGRNDSSANGSFYEDSFVKPPLIAALMGGTLWALREGR